MGRGEAGVLPAESPTKALRGDGSVDDAWGGGAFAGGTLPQAHPGDGAVLGYVERVACHGLVLLPLVPVLDVAENRSYILVTLDDHGLVRHGEEIAGANYFSLGREVIIDARSPIAATTIAEAIE